MKGRATCGVTLLALLLAQGSARADTPFDTAQSLFDEAKTLALSNHWAEACPLLERSWLLESNMVTAYRLADCYEHVGKTASAWTRYLQAASLAKAAGASQRYEGAMARVTALEPKLARVRVVVASPVADDTVVLNDGRPLARELWGTFVAVDAGAHEVQASAAGRTVFRVQYSATDGATSSVEVPVLAPSPPPPKPSPVVPPLLPPKAVEPAPPSPLVPVGVVATAVGVVAVGVSVGLGIAAKKKDRDADALCAGSRCGQEGQSLSDDARTLGNIGTAFFFSGVAVATTGIVLWVVGATRSPSTATARARARALTGTWAF